MMPANEVIKMRATEFIRENVEHFNGLDFSIEIEKMLNSLINKLSEN